MENFAYSEIDQIKELPGCYCWYIDWTRLRLSDFEFNENKRSALINAIFKVYSPNPISINAQRLLSKKAQYFGETYSGTIEFRGIRINDSSSLISKDFKLFESFLTFVNSIVVPLYIGKSKNLKRRIGQHIDFLENSKFSSGPNLGDFDFEEMKNFSERFGNVLLENESLGLRTSMLSVKIIYLNEEEITEFESNLNYIFKPLFGIK